MTGSPPPPDQDLAPQPPADPGPAVGPPPAAPGTPEIPGSPAPQNPDSWTLPPVAAGYGAAPLPLRRRDSRRNRLLVVMAVLMALMVLSGVAVAITSRNAHTIVSSSSTDGTFKAGDCVSLSATRVTSMPCSGAHDAQIVQVIHSGQRCPTGVEEFDVNDGTGNLCLDRGNNAKG